MYNWAVNKIKLNVAIDALRRAAVGNPDIIVNEETIKAEYVKRGGLLNEEAPEAESAEGGESVELEDMKVPQLRELAATSNIDISGAKNKAEIIEAIRAHAAATVEDPEAGDASTGEPVGEASEGEPEGEASAQ